MLVKVDLHLHSEFSWDSKVPIESYIQRAEQLNFGAIAITDHNDIQSHQKIERLQSQTDVILVPGQEVSTKDGHLLVYGWTERVPKDLTMKESVEFAKSQGERVICVAAHPFDILRSGKGRKVGDSGIDGVETLNASSLFGIFNWRARKFADQRFAIQLGNSDSHRLAEFGTAYTELPPCNDLDGVLSNLSHGKAKGRRIGIPRKTVRFLRRKLNMMTS